MRALSGHLLSFRASAYYPGEPQSDVEQRSLGLESLEKSSKEDLAGEGQPDRRVISHPGLYLP